MTISATGASHTSPLARLQAELSSEVSAGTVNSADQSALSGALSDIDTALKSDRDAGGSPPAPGDIQAKINDLIANEVSKGKLTSDQAEELKNVFANAFQGAPQGGDGPPPGGGPGGPGGGGGAGGAGGGNNSTDPADLNKDGTVTAAEQAEYDAEHGNVSVSSSSDSADSSSANTSTDTKDTDLTKVLNDFIKSLQESQGGSSGYSAEGNNLLSQIQSLVVNFTA